MALDFSLKINKNDLQFVESEQWRIYNMIKNYSMFVDNPAIYLNIAKMVSDGVSEDAMRGMILDWFGSFEINLNGLSFSVENGKLIINYIGGSYVFS